MDDVDCTGEEESLLDCHHRGLMLHNCAHYEDASVVCYNGELGCFIIFLICKVFHFSTGCEEGEIRLADGNATAGRVEVCLSGVWGKVCDNHWDIREARVTCRKLGLPFQCE